MLSFSEENVLSLPRRKLLSFLGHISITEMAKQIVQFKMKQPNVSLFSHSFKQIISGLAMGNLLQKKTTMQLIDAIVKNNLLKFQLKSFAAYLQGAES